MNFLSLEYFLVVAEEKNFTTASNQLYISQQALSAHLKKLEEELGTQLFLRTRPLELTEAGKIFLDGTRRILAERDNVLSELRAAQQIKEQKLVLAVSTFEAPPLLPEIIEQFAKRYPDVEIEVTKRIKDKMDGAEDGFDLYFDFPPLSSKLEHIPLVDRDCFCVALRRSLIQSVYGSEWESVLRQTRSRGDLCCLKEVPFLLLKGRSGRIPQFSQDVFGAYGFTPVIGFQSDNGDLNSMLCLQGRGAQIGSYFYERSRFYRELDVEDPICLIPLKKPLYAEHISLGYRPGKCLSAVERNFISMLREILQQHTQMFSGGPYDLTQIIP
ncbi:MAG: LysR family transcriptional regulator [Oscillospiraceae bacterium]|nr:LysR family transcriptional regulator [Oscillospiraceae bacterium]